MEPTEGTETPEVITEPTDTPVPENADNTAPTVDADPAAPSDSAKQGDNVPLDEGDPEVIKDEQGNEFIPKAAFDARIAKLTAQKHEAIPSFIEAIKSDQEVRKQVLEALGASPEPKEDAIPDGVPQGVSPYETWLEKNVTPEYQGHYKQMADSLYQTILPHIQAHVKEAMSPILSFIGKKEVDTFATSHPDYSKYKDKITQMVTSGRAKNLEDAYRIVSWEDKMRGAGAAALSSEKARQAKLAGTPIKRASGAPATGRPTKFGSFGKAAEFAADKLGM